MILHVKITGQGQGHFSDGSRSLDKVMSCSVVGAAKSALSLPIANMRFPAYDLAAHVSKFCLKEWQNIWDACQANKLWWLPI